MIRPPKSFEPLLSKAVEFKHLDYTNLWMSPKYDGIRAIIRNGQVVSRKLLPIPNKYVQACFGNRPELEGYDGELIVGEPNAHDVYSKTYSGVMSQEGECDLKFFAFDHVTNPLDEYFRRYDRISDNVRGVIKVPQSPVECVEDLLMFETELLEDGYEGVMLRAFQGQNSLYKYGRSTAKSNTLLKLKRLEDFDAQIVGFEEEMFNGNEATVDELGRTKRSSHQDNKVGKGTLGAFICSYKNGLTFRVGIFKGMNAADKQDIWDNKEAFLGQWTKQQKLPIGEKDRPRHPRVIEMLGFRSPLDMS